MLLLCCYYAATGLFPGAIPVPGADSVPEQADPASEQGDPASEQADPAPEQADSASEQADPVPEQADPVPEQGDPASEQGATRLPVAATRLLGCYRGAAGSCGKYHTTGGKLPPCGRAMLENGSRVSMARSDSSAPIVHFCTLLCNFCIYGPIGF